MHPRSVLFVGEPSRTNPMRWYRMILPLRSLNQAGWQCHWAPILAQREDGLVYGYTPAAFVGGRSFMDSPGMWSPPCKHVVLRRMIDPTQSKEQKDGSWKDSEIDSVEMFTQARERGQFIFLDFDDDLWEVPEWHPARKQLSHRDMATMKRNMAASDCVIASTPDLAAALARRVDGPAIAVVRNGVDPSTFEPHHDHFPLRILWPGTLNYKAPDFSSIVPALREALDGYRDRVELWHLGQHDGCDTVLSELCGPTFPVAIRERPWVDIAKLPQALAQADIGILPHLDNAFNRCRSWTGPMAFSAASVPWIGSPLPEYQEMKIGLRPARHEDWVYALRSLIELDFMRKIQGEEGRQFAAEHGPEFIVKQYAEVFAGVTMVA